MRLLLFALLTAAAFGCSIINTDHCGNLDGDATCHQRGGDAPFCSVCVANNNGCVAEVPDDACQATSSVPDETTTTVTPTTMDGPDPSTSTGTTTPTPTTSTGTDTTDPSSTSAPKVDTSTGDDDSTSTGHDISTSTGDDTSTGDGTSTSGSDTSTGDDSTSDSTSDTDATTEEPDLCGNNQIDPPEVCDGTDHGGKTCETIAPNKWGGGSLSCNPGCASFNDTNCCIGVQQPCKPLNPEDGVCCEGLSCQYDGLLQTYRCKN